MMHDLVQWLADNEPEFRKSRLPSLYSDLGQLKSSNPDGFAANVSAWQTALRNAARAAQLPAGQKIIVSTSAQLLEALRSPQYGEPAGLGMVFDTAVQEGKMMTLDQFLASEQSIYQKSWVPSPAAVVRWALRQAGLMSTGSFDQSGRLRASQLVILDTLEAVSRQIVAAQAQQGQGLTDRCFSRRAFAKLVQATDIGTLSAEELEVLLKYLSRDKSILSYNDTVVKFKSPSSVEPEAITQEDMSIVVMKETIASINASVKELNSKITSLQLAAQSGVQSKNRNAALSALRSKKRAESALESRTNTLDQLEEVYAKIEQAVDQVQVVQVMQSSAETLRSLNKQTGGVDRVDSIMDDLRDQMTQVDEVGQIVREPLDSKAQIDDIELDEELEAMETEEKARKEEIEAQATSNKLAELKQSEEALKQSASADDVKSVEGVDLNDELSSSAQKLERMQLDDQSHDQSHSLVKSNEPLPAT